MKYIEITSLTNGKIKELIKFRQKNGKNDENDIIIEGIRELSRAQHAGIELSELYYCSELVNSPEEKFILLSLQTQIKYQYKLSKDVFEKIAYKNNPLGILVKAKFKITKLNSLKLSQNPLILACETIEKPGNLGALLRTADGAGVNAVISCDFKTDFRNPNVIRASTGTIFAITYCECSTTELIDFAKKNNIMICAADPDAKIIYTNVDFTKPSILIVGAEDIGLSEQIKTNADVLIKIPMCGYADSLNVNQSAAIILYEAMRQRNLN